MAAEGMPFPWRWNGGTISTVLDVIWGMSVNRMIPESVHNYLSDALPPRLSIHYRALCYWRWGEREVRLVRHLCQHDKLSVDVGAHEGLYTYFLQRHSAATVAFEPNPPFHESLISTFPHRIRILHYALSNKSGDATLRIPVADHRTFAGSATIESENIFDECTSIRVETRTLDSFNFENVGFIKIDVEGHELSVLKGAEQTISTYCPNFIIEIEERHKNGSISSTHTYLKSLGYLGFFLIGDTIQGFDYFDCTKHQNTDNINKGLYVNNFLFIHKSYISLYEPLLKLESLKSHSDRNSGMVRSCDGKDAINGIAVDRRGDAGHVGQGRGGEQAQGGRHRAAGTERW